MFTKSERRDLAACPIPAYELAERDRLTGGLQYSSGCPYRCEFRDIPVLHGRNPRRKRPEQVTAELDRFLACGGIGGPIYFVDDNFIGERRAIRALLPVLIDLQMRRGHPFTFACEATPNLAKRPDILELMRQARFETVFCGIETPEPEILKAMAKGHNMAVPILEGIDSLNRHGLEFVSGIMVGLDTDTADTERSQIPVLTINLLQAFPRAPL